MAWYLNEWKAGTARAREREREERDSVILREKKGNEKKTNEKDRELGWGKNAK